TPPKPANRHPSMPVVSPVRPIQLTSAIFDGDNAGNRGRRAANDVSSSIGVQAPMEDAGNAAAFPSQKAATRSRPHNPTVVAISSSSDSEDCLFLTTVLRS